MANKYTVVVLYPKYACKGEWPMTYTALVEAEDPFDARFVGASEARSKAPRSERGNLIDWVPLLTFNGHKHPVNYSWQTPPWPGVGS